MNGSLGKHGVVLELRLAEGRSVGGDDNELSLARLSKQSAYFVPFFNFSIGSAACGTHTQGLDGGLVAKGD